MSGCDMTAPLHGLDRDNGCDSEPVTRIRAEARSGPRLARYGLARAAPFLRVSALTDDEVVPLPVAPRPEIRSRKHQAVTDASRPMTTVMSGKAKYFRRRMT